ncbi:hypothetical protein GCM10023107_73590 [Actinoplanes octamycinicus]|nr:hypothetical protein Aoc01nite_90790 [Actinoplanes octamycinicus]
MVGVPAQPSRDAARAEVVEDLIDALRLFTVETDVFVHVFARQHGLSRNDLNAIMWISQGTQTGHPISPGELATRLGLGGPATTGLIDRLESAGHVRRERDARDRRKVTILMQPRALQLATDFFVPLGALMHEAVADLSAEDLHRSIAVINRMVTAVAAARDSAARDSAARDSAARDSAAAPAGPPRRADLSAP